MTIRSIVVLLCILAFEHPQWCDAAVISEFEPNPAGIDQELQAIELSGKAGNAFSGVLLGLGGESGRVGRIDFAAEITGVFDSNGLLTTEIRDLFSPTLTVVVAESFSGVVGRTDVDSNDDGIADNLSTIGTIFDAIGIADNVVGERFLYGAQLGGQDFGFTGDEPELVFRDASVGNWYAINGLGGTEIHDIDGRNVESEIQFDFDPFAPTFGRLNPSISAVPEPSLMFPTCLAFASILFLRRTRECPNK